MLRARAGADPTHVVVLATVGTRPRKRRERRRGRTAEPEPEPTPVPIARATVVDVAEGVESEEEAGALLADGSTRAQRALHILNSVIRGHRAAAADPYAREVAAEQALVVRVGYGAGEQVAEGRWAYAFEVDVRPARPRRVAALRPQERLAALLGGRDRVLACEELVLRARLDLDEGRPREAALQLRVALEAALAELAGEADLGDLRGRLDELRERRGPVGAAANEALGGELDQATVRAVTQTVERLEATLRARAVRGL